MKHIIRIILVLTLALPFLQPARAVAANAAEIRAASRNALDELYAKNAKARAIGSKAVAVLVFPNITKGGFIVAGQTGEGTLFTSKGVAGYYRSVAASYGFQAGLQKFGYALFFMNNKALKQLDSSRGWEVGSAPSLVVIDQGVSLSISTTSLQKDIYACFFNQKGLMGGLGLQGSKITRIRP